MTPRDSKGFQGGSKGFRDVSRGFQEVTRAFQVVPIVSKEVPSRIHREGNENIVYNNIMKFKLIVYWFCTV